MIRKGIIPDLITWLVIALCLGAALDWMRFLLLPPEIPSRIVVFTIPPGESLASATRRLALNSLTSSSNRLRLLARARDDQARIRAGEYALETGWKPDRLLDALTRGPTLLHRLTIPEGLAWWQTAELTGASGLADTDDFSVWATNATWVRSLGIPAETLEGYLWPDTYLLPRPTTNDPRPVILAMLAQFKAQAGPEFQRAGLTDPALTHDVVTLASLIEKESARPEERATIAGVFANRLDRGMLLQCDPTIIYGLAQAFDGNLTRNHLRDSDNPYNSYRHSGLPPGPICSPGLEAIRAALNPEEHDLLFFVAKGDGSHKFSRTLEEHNRAVNRYQRNRP